MPTTVTTKSRIHAPLTIHDFIIHKYTTEINAPNVIQRQELVKLLRKRFLEDFSIDTIAVFSGNKMYVLMFDTLNPQNESPTQTTDNTKQIVTNIK